MTRERSSRTRKIIHVDMDMFFAAVEMRDNPSLRNKPLVVGGQPNTRSVVSTANYIARRFGIHSAMSCAEAKRLCPDCVFVSPDFKKYRKASEQIREIFHDYTDLVETVSLDEAYLDVTENRKNEKYASTIAKEIKKRIFQTTRLTASAGVAPNKFVAKIASDFRKPDGLCVVPPESVLSFINDLPVIKVPYIGKVTSKKLEALGIIKVSDIKLQELDFLEDHFGKFGRYLYDISRGIDESEVVAHYERQSYGSEDTFSYDIIDKHVIFEYLKDSSKRLLKQLEDRNLFSRTVTLKIKYHDFKTITRSHTEPDCFDNIDTVHTIIEKLLDRTEAGRKSIRLAGLSFSSLYDPDNEEDTVTLPMQLEFDFYSGKEQSCQTMTEFQ